MTCPHCTDLQQAVVALINAVEQLAAGSPGSADQYAQSARYWVHQ